MAFSKSMLLLLVPMLIGASFSCGRKKAYAVTTYSTSFDSHISPSYIGKKLKYLYEEYNSDSNLIYQERYGTPSDYDEIQNKLCERSTFFYKGKNKIKAKIEYGLVPSSGQKDMRKKYVDTYEYTNDKLTQWISDGKLKEAYEYNNKGELEKKSIYMGKLLAYFRTSYSNGLKTKTQTIVADTIESVDTFMYDRNNKLIDTYSYDSRGKTTVHRQIVRNEKGKAIEEKWKEPYIGWRSRANGELINDEFYQVNKYFYDTKGRSIKTEFYDIGNLTTVYEFEYN